MGLIIPVFIPHRGCPHQCLFCNQQAISGREHPVGDDAGEVSGVIDTWLARSPGRNEVQVAFYGGSFTCLARPEQQRLLAAVQPYLADGRVKGIRLSTRPDCIGDETCALLIAAGVKTVELGVQSLDDMVLRKARRGHSADDSRRAMHTLREGGLRVGVQLLPGLPGETTRSFLRTVREVADFRPDLVRLYPAVVVAHSELAGMYRNGQYTPLTLNRAIAMVRRAKELFDAAGVPVIRMGLQPSDALAKEVVAGPYHPAFGELVTSRGWFRQLRSRLGRCLPGEHLQVHISSRDYSAVVGMKKLNMQRLAQLGHLNRFTIVPDTLRERGSIEYVVC